MRALMRPLLLALLFLPVATAACAEGAWVLWLYSLNRRTDADYSVAGSYSTQQECEGEMRGIAETMKKMGYAVTVGGPSDRYVIGEKEPTNLKYFCLPDTVDPRGLKGK